MGHRLANVRQHISTRPPRGQCSSQCKNCSKPAHSFYQKSSQPDTAATDLPELETRFAQALSEDLRTKLIRHLHLLPSQKIDRNLRRLNSVLEHVINAKKELKLTMNAAERALHGAGRTTCGNRETPIKEEPHVLS
jgi:hypothetical protein